MWRAAGPRKWTCPSQTRSQPARQGGLTLMLHIQISRFIKKIEKDDKFLTSCLTIAREAEHKVMQNNCVDIYRCDHGNAIFK